MPLVIITGLPTSGKTTRARQLQAYLTERIEASASAAQPSGTGTGTGTGAAAPRYRLHVISDQTQAIRRGAYDLSRQRAHARSANAGEKDARSALAAAVRRALGPRDIVVLDGLNYIKGWRYQLFCEAKNAGTPSCVLQVGCAVERARAVNEARLEARRRRRRRRKGGEGEEEKKEEGDVVEDDKDDDDDDDDGDDGDEGAYGRGNWENLVFRYEEPNAMTRWDSPLFTLIWEDDEARAREVFGGIWEAIAGEGRKAVRPNQSTVQRGKDSAGDYLYLLERETQDIVRGLVELQGEEGGGEVRLPRGGAGGEDLVVELPGRKVGLPQLQRYRRAYVALNRGGIGLEGVGTLAVERLRESFVGYLNDAFEREE